MLTRGQFRLSAVSVVLLQVNSLTFRSVPEFSKTEDFMSANEPTISKKTAD